MKCARPTCRTAAALAAGVFAALVLIAQTQPTHEAPPSFEVAMIKPTPPDERYAGHWSLPDIGRFSAQGVSVERLIILAYGVDGNQITAKPPWLDNDLYDIDAKPEDGVKLSRDELKPRLQSLLAERFHLAAHFETRTVRGYALVVAKSGPKLHPTKGNKFPGYRVRVSSGHIEGINWSMPILAAALQQPAGLPVVDETGLIGSYDIKLEFAPDNEPDSTMPSLFTAVRETLGLELKAQSVSASFLVIDHIDRVPVAN
jgi:uncharacterized protein (TIGR03435 family)